MLTPEQWETYRNVIARLEAREKALEAGLGPMLPSRSWDDTDTEVAMDGTGLS